MKENENLNKIIISYSLGIITDHIVRSNKITLTNARKVSNSLTSFIPVLCMISFCFCDESRQIVGVITVLIFLASSGKNCIYFIDMNTYLLT